MTDFEYKRYRCEWVARVFTVDQYGKSSSSSEVWWESVWPTREEALQALHSVTLEGHPRRVFPNAKHDYYGSEVFYREVHDKSSD